MPELPEVETVRRGLASVLVGQRFVAVETLRPDLRFPLVSGFVERLSGQRVKALSRRAKYLLAHLSSGDILVMHLGMTGRFSVAANGHVASSLPGLLINDSVAAARHDHILFHMSNGSVITYNDPRRFGFMLLLSDAELAGHKMFRHLGVEPLSGAMTDIYLAGRAARRRCNLKAFLMDQRVVAGLGNIYVCEALHAARLSPERDTGCLVMRSGRPARRAGSLVAAIRRVLRSAMRAGGSSVRDYRKTDGGKGTFQEKFAVYDREKLRCARSGCRGTIRRAVHSGRSTFYCPVCQR